MNRIRVATALAAAFAVPHGMANAQDIVAIPSGASASAKALPLPAELSLSQALSRGEDRSPTLAAARADVAAAEGRLRQAGFRTNPEFSLELENFAGTGALSGFRTTEITASLNQRIDVTGRRRTRVSIAEARLIAAQLELAIARAEMVRQIRTRFAQAVAARALLALAQESVERYRELARVAGALVEAGREPPLRALRAQSAFAQGTAALRSAEATEGNARASLAALLGSDRPPTRLVGDMLIPLPATLDPEATPDVVLAKARAAIARAELAQGRVERRLDPSVGIGVRHVRETGDVGLVAGISMPLAIFDRNQGNIAASRSELEAAEARVLAAQTEAAATVANARASLSAAEARVNALEQNGLAEGREALRLAELSYRAGKASLVELLDAQQSYAAARSELIVARQARAEAAATLARQGPAQ